MNITKQFITTGLRLSNSIMVAAFASLFVLVAGCSKSSSSSVDITGNWIEPALHDDTYTTWSFKPDGTFTSVFVFNGKVQKSETGTPGESGTYRIRPPRPSADTIPGDIIECSSPKWENSKLFRIPPHSSTLLIKVNCDDDSLSGGRPDNWVAKEGASPVRLQASDAAQVFTGIVVSIERKSKSVILLLDAKVHGKEFKCAIIDDATIQRLGDVKKLEGKKIEIKGQPEEHRRSVFLFIEDAEDIKVFD